jgi:hypothetical protein
VAAGKAVEGDSKDRRNKAVKIRTEDS